MSTASTTGRSNKFAPKKRHLWSGEPQSLLKEEIAQLQKELDSQTMIRSMLEKAMNHQPMMDDPTNKSFSQPAEDLVREIAHLELEVVYLEKYLLSLYRKSFAKRLSTLDEAPKTCSNWVSLEVGKTNLDSVDEHAVVRCDDSLPMRCNDPLIDSGIYRSHSSLSQHSACSFRTASPLFEAVDAYHSLPLSMLESSNANLAEPGFPEHERETPNWLSEEMIKCISTIYYHLSDPPQLQEVSCEDACHVDGSGEFSGSFYTMVEIRAIVRDSQRLNSVQELLQSYKSLISKLGQVDPWKLKHEEKLAFWINVHNALVMHAFLVYGIPRGSLKKVSLVLKAAYNIGGHTVSVDALQSCILRCRLPRPTLWLHSLFLRKTKFKAGDPREAYAVKHAEPRLHFALCSGCHSDPAVRLYTPKKVFEELEMAKEEYIQMNIKIHKEERLVIPKKVDHFSKEIGLSPSGVAEMVQHSMPPESWTKVSHQRKVWKKVDWIPHNFSFRFLLSNELVR